MRRTRIATARFTASTYAQGPTQDRIIHAGERLLFLHRSDDGLSTFFAIENEEERWPRESKNVHPLQYEVATDSFDASTEEAK